MGTYHNNVFGCFIWDLQETSQRRANGKSWICNTETSLGASFETCLRRRCNVSIRRQGDVPLRCLGDAALRRRWLFHLGCTYDVVGTYRDVVTTSPRRLNVGWVIMSHIMNLILIVFIYHLQKVI